MASLTTTAHLTNPVEVLPAPFACVVNEASRLVFQTSGLSSSDTRLDTAAAFQTSGSRTSDTRLDGAVKCSLHIRYSVEANGYSWNS